MANLHAPPSSLSRHADASLIDQLSDLFGERIRQRLLPGGARLPSVRDCAQRHQVSPSTVVAAYDRLLAQGLIEARPQRGFFVRDTPPPTLRDPPPAGPTHIPLSATTLLRGMLQPQGGKPMPGMGTLPIDWLDPQMLSQALKKVCTAAQQAQALEYADPAGHLRLRQALSLKLQDHGVSASPGQIVTTLGATQALDIISRTLTRAGDTVLVDEPGWSIEYARLNALGLRLLPVPRGEDGPDLAVMAQLIRSQPVAQRPRLYVTVSVLHNPTGNSLSLQSAHRVLQLAQEHDFYLIEDDSYAHLAPAHLPRLSALDALQRTFYVSGFSKILTPNWRVGYLAAPQVWVDRLIDTKILTSLTTPSLLEHAMAHCLEQDGLRRHAQRMVHKLDQARAHSVKLAEHCGARFVTPPRGLFGWLDVGVDTERLAQRMLDDGWVLAPGTLFHANRRPTTLMRINFATTQDARFWKTLARAIGDCA